MSVRLAVWILGSSLCACGDADVIIGAHAVDARADVPPTADASATADVATLPPACMTTPDCVTQCPRISRGCVCAPTMMGLRCVPTCVLTAECPPAPTGMMLFCRMGLCVP